ncbi:MAG: acetylglutamate kinase [Atopobiaceae bacterium]|nr:acetylglutamate kinase [Atopobiaceae bacterium]
MIIHKQHNDPYAMKQVEALIEALPWINKMQGQTFVVKYGGSAMEDAKLRHAVLDDLMLLRLVGIRLVIVHGGGKAITELMDRLQLPVSWSEGQRVTDDAAMEAVQMALIGKVNQDLVSEMNHYGAFATGVSGSDGCTLTAEQADPALGRVGKVTEVNASLIESLLDNGYVPVVGGVARGEDGLFNVNADIVASQIAAALKADKLIYLSDVDGYYQNPDDPDTLVSSMTFDEARELVESGVLHKGMIPKFRSIVEAAEAGVGCVHLINGTQQHCLLREVFTDNGVGTMLYDSSEEGVEYDAEVMAHGGDDEESR